MSGRSRTGGTATATQHAHNPHHAKAWPAAVPFTYGNGNRFGGAVRDHLDRRIRPWFFLPAVPYLAEPGAPASPYGMATVRPYIVPVKGVSLYIVYQHLNRTDAS